MKYFSSVVMSAVTCGVSGSLISLMAEGGLLSGLGIGLGIWAICMSILSGSERIAEAIENKKA